MRVYRPTYSIPRPKGAKILARKSGKYATFTSKRGQEITAKLTKSRKRVVLETTHYCIEFRDHSDVLRRLKAFTDRESSDRVAATTQDLLNARGSGQSISQDLRKRIESLPAPMRNSLAKWGLLDGQTSLAAKPLTELLHLYIDSLRAAERNAEYVRRTEGDLKTVFAACGWDRFSDITADRLAEYLRQRREKGIGYRRSNELLVACKSFCSYVCGDDPAVKSPLDRKSLRSLNVEQDRRHVRRALEPEELRRLLDVTGKSQSVCYRLTGPQRAMLYRLAAETGIRRGELSRLRVGDFDFAGRTITLSAAITKNHRQRTVPLTERTAAELQEYLRSKLPTARALRIPRATARMLRQDLSAAGIPYRDEEGHVFDFHSLRVECSTLLVEGGADPKVAQEILGHSDIRLTLQTYARVLKAKTKKHAAAEAVAALIDRAG